MTDTRRICTFLLGGQLFGIDVMSVQEVTRYHEMTPVPLARAVGGLINLRGQIVTAIETRAVLGLGPREATRLPMNVVVNTEEGTVSLLVDEIGDVIDVFDDTFEPAPATVPSAVRELLVGVYKLDGALLSLLDVGRVAQRVKPKERAA